MSESWRDTETAPKNGTEIELLIRHANHTEGEGEKMNDQQQTPLIDLLRRVPHDARATYEHDATSHSMIPYGRLCHEAAKEIERLYAELTDRAYMNPPPSQEDHAAGLADGGGPNTGTRASTKVEFFERFATLQANTAGQEAVVCVSGESPEASPSPAPAVPAAVFGHVKHDYRCESCGEWFDEPMPSGHAVVKQSYITLEPYPDQCGPVTKALRARAEQLNTAAQVEGSGFIAEALPAASRPEPAPAVPAMPLPPILQVANQITTEYIATLRSHAEALQRRAEAAEYKEHSALEKAEATLAEWPKRYDDSMQHLQEMNSRYIQRAEKAEADLKALREYIYEQLKDCDDGATPVEELARRARRRMERQD